MAQSPRLAVTAEPWCPPVSVRVVYDDRRRARDLRGHMFAAVPAVRRVVGVASSEELTVLFGGRPDQMAVVGMHRAEPSGLPAIRRVVAARPGGAVVAVGARDDTSSAGAAVALGASGYVGRDAPPTVTRDLVQALMRRQASRRPSGEGSVRPERRWNRSGTEGAVDAEDVAVDRAVQERLGLSARETEVLTSISHGLSVEGIGRDLALSSNTIKSHVRQVFVKLGVHERAHAVAHACRSGLFAVPVGAAPVR